MHFSNILAPLDFSDSTPFVLQAAGRFAELFDAKITPFHSYVHVSTMYANDPFALEGMSEPMIPNTEEMEKTYQEQLQKTSLEHVAEKWLGKPVVGIGDPVTTITEAADDYDLIVIGSHGRSGFSRMFMGSVSDKILRSVHKPVLIVSQEKQLKSIDTIMLTTDFSEHSKKAFPLAVDIAKKTHARVVLVHILAYNLSRGEPEEEEVSRQKQRLDVMAEQELPDMNDQLETKVIVASSNAHEAILDESLNNPYDMAIMAAVGHTGIEYLMLGGTTSNVVRHIQIPVISINPKVKQSSDEEE